ncbi:GFA family protein [Propionivibrio soli]|uniref:GFA family protein n=1 Tax=Propionivibrio soli TaxID=2976531 RepID=UPI0021E741DB|nr:GFA family protein [Propionivibrio soli]
METKKGSCHCGAVEFEVDLENGFGELRRCNCSLCRRKGAIIASVPLNRLRVTKGADMLTLYQWNTMTAKHYFCSVCGIYTHHQRRSNPNLFGFNLACIEGVDPFSFCDVEVSDGASHSLVDDAAEKN